MKFVPFTHFYTSVQAQKWLYCQPTFLYLTFNIFENVITHAAIFDIAKEAPFTPCNNIRCHAKEKNI